jgi:hypothetical protein
MCDETLSVWEEAHLEASVSLQDIDVRVSINLWIEYRGGEYEFTLSFRPWSTAYLGFHRENGWLAVDHVILREFVSCEGQQYRVRLNHRAWSFQAYPIMFVGKLLIIVKADVPFL